MTKDERKQASNEEQSAERRGVLRVTTGSLNVPEGIEADSASAGDPINRVVIVVVALALAFIAFVAWLIHGGQ